VTAAQKVPGDRLTYIDWARAIAMLLMIEAHTTDAWTAATAKRAWAFRDLAILGGFAAPMFLWLAGLAVVLSAGRIVGRGGERRTAVQAICRRGLEIFVLAFLFRLQAFAVSPGSYAVTLFRVDILNIMGPAIVAAALIWALSRQTGILVLLYTAAAVLVAMVTPLVRTNTMVDLLPIWLQWYVRPAGDYTTFTGFPWVGFVFAGAACGALITAAGRERELRLQLVLAAAGLGIVALGFYTASRPSIYRESSFWTTSPTWFAIRVGILMVALPIVYGLARLARARSLVLDALGRFGRSSLFVYWIHMELVYGYVAWPLRHRLPLWGTAVAYLLFVGLMFAAISARDRLVDRWQGRRSPVPATRPSPRHHLAV
jgi:uncharacterized membrane protein